MKVVRRPASAKSNGRTKAAPSEHLMPEMRAEQKESRCEIEKLRNENIRLNAENEMRKEEITYLRLQCKEKTEDMRQETVLRGHEQGAAAHAVERGGGPEQPHEPVEHSHVAGA